MPPASFPPPPKLLLRGLPAFRAPSLWSRGWAELSQAQGLLCQPLGMAAGPEWGGTSGLVRFRGSLGPAKGQDLTLGVLGQPLPSHTLRLPLQVGGYPHQE